jgi:hypothetical protein
LATEQKHQNRCSFCGAKLSLGYHFSCHFCGEDYCYIHMSRHDRAHQTPETRSISTTVSSGLVIIGQ